MSGFWLVEASANSEFVQVGLARRPICVEHAKEALGGASRGQSLAILSRLAGGAFLWLQPAGRESLGGEHPELVEAGHDGWREGAHLRR
jgi:hypothetical protein